MRWERELLAFLRRELAPSPARWRATARLAIACALSIALVMALHVPDGEFMLISLFVVSLGNAGASITKGWQRVLGTLVAGALAIVILTTSADKPWLLFPLHAVVIGAALFLSRTTTAPYAFLLAGITFAMVVPAYPADPAGAIGTALWRVALTVLGVAIGTAAQLLLWPDDPEELLLDDFAHRLADTTALLDQILARRAGDPVPVVAGVAPVGVTGQLDLLESAESHSRWLRQRHTEQIGLIAEMQLLVTAARRLGRLAVEQPVPAWALPRIAAVRDACERLRRGFATRTEPVPAPAPGAGTDPDPAALDALEIEMLAAVHELERAVASLPASMGFLAQGAVTTATAPAPIREPVAERPLFTSACSLANTEAVRFALKGAIATSICVLVMEASNAPGLATSVISCVVVAQSFFGAGLRKGLLRLAGAAAGGLLALLVIVATMPNMETLASLLVVSVACFAAAAWILSGSSRISYVGLQMAIVLALTIINPGAPTTDLAPVRDRVLGILLGIGVMAAVDVALWPVFGRTALRRALADTLAQIASLQRAAAAGGLHAVRERALGVYRTLGNALAMHDDIQLEPSVDDAMAAQRGALLRVTHDVESVFLRLLAASRHRPAALPAAVGDALGRLDEATATALDALGGCLLDEAALPPTPRPDAVHTVGLPPADAEFARLSERLLEAVGQLADDMVAVAHPSAAVTAPSRPRPRSRTPAPQPS